MSDTRWLRWRVVEHDYMHRLPLLPRNPVFNVYIHRYFGSDMNRDMHDHPYPSVAFLLWGRLTEVLPGPSHLPDYLHTNLRYRRVRKWLPVYREAHHIHRVELGEGCKGALTVFIHGPRWRKWGFYTLRGWVEASQYFGSRYYTAEEPTNG